MVPYNQLCDIDWQYRSTPQKQACLGLNNHVAFYPRGKVLGGTSITNYMLYVRGSPTDFDHWARDLGADGWSYENVLPYFKKLEAINFNSADSDFRGKSGPIQVKEMPATRFGGAFFEATREFGYKRVLDYNGKSQSGFGIFQANIDKWGLRSSTSREFLHPAMAKHKNLHVLSEAHVSKVIFDEKKRATSVEFIHDGKKHRVNSKREIILSAGAFGSAQILQLSGVGPNSLLQRHQIPVVNNLPAVGQNMADHFMIHIGITNKLDEQFVKHQVSEFSMEWNPNVELSTYNINDRTAGYETDAPMIKHWWDLVTKGEGNLAITGGEISGMIKSRPELPVEDLQLVVVPRDVFGGGKVFNIFNIGADIQKSWYGNHTEGKGIITLISNLEHPFSLGQLEIQSSNPLEYPKIELNYLKDERDVKATAKGLRILDDLMMKSKAMQQFRPTRMNSHLPACKEHTFFSDSYLECLVRQFTLTVYHASGTCRIGKDPRKSVVDPRLRVHGVKGLRVADASVFPDQVTGNTHAASMMVGEKAADIIRQDWTPTK